MGYSLENVVPWGRTFDEYVAMFSLSEDDLRKKILGCADGPASFNAELTRRGGNVISVDPVYSFSAGEIEKRIKEVYDEVLEQARINRDEFVWSRIRTVEDLGRIRMNAMKIFLEDYVLGRERYVASDLPNLPFVDNTFDIALCSHFLFLYSECLSLEFHLNAINELLRVSSEVRIFPLLELGATRSKHLDRVLESFEGSEYECRIEKVPYEFQRGGNEMLRIKPLVSVGGFPGIKVCNT